MSSRFNHYKGPAQFLLGVRVQDLLHFLMAKVQGRREDTEIYHSNNHSSYKDEAAEIPIPSDQDPISMLSYMQYLFV